MVSELRGVEGRKMRHEERARLLLLRKRISLVEAPYIVAVELGGGYDDALSLVLEAVKDEDLKADAKPAINEWNGAVVDPVDPHATTIAVSDLLSWMRKLIAQVPAELTPKLAAVGQFTESALLSSEKKISNIPPSQTAPTSIQSSPAIVEDRHTLKSAKQEAAVLEWLRQSGYDPASLPKPAPGKPGVKADAKRAMLGNPALFTQKVFESTWERLRGTGQIADANPPPSK
ncbi:hypothetical protein [Noviherbaspirillum autotrophicum]|nr:hypothetical protein [Noviherbaspirillum autotrophicum]